MLNLAELHHYEFQSAQVILDFEVNFANQIRHESHINLVNSIFYHDIKINSHRN